MMEAPTLVAMSFDEQLRGAVVSLACRSLALTNPWVARMAGAVYRLSTLIWQAPSGCLTLSVRNRLIN